MRPADDDPATTAALAAHQAGGVRWLGGGGIAAVLGVLVGAAAVVQAEDGRRIPGVGLLAVLLVLGGLVAGVVGIGALLRTARWRRALAAAPWQVGHLRIAGPAIIAFEPAGFDELTDQPVHLRLLTTAVWRTRAVQQLDGAQIRAAPVNGAEWVLTADGLDTLVGARQVRAPR